MSWHLRAIDLRLLPSYRLSPPTKEERDDPSHGCALGR